MESVLALIPLVGGSVAGLKGGWIDGTPKSLASYTIVSLRSGNTNTKAMNTKAKERKELANQYTFV